MTTEAAHLLTAGGGFLGLLLVYRFVSPRVVPLCFPGYHTLPWEKKIQVNEIFMAGSHSIIVCIASWVAYFTVEELKPTTLWYNCAVVRHTSAFFLGYSIADLGLILCYPHFGDMWFIMHHVVSIISGFLGMHYTSIPYYVNMFLMMELTNPFVNFRFMLKALGYPEKSRLFATTGVLLFVSWLIARIIPLPIYVYHMGRLMASGEFFKIEVPMQLCSTFGYLFFTVLNMSWFRIILKLFKRELRGLLKLESAKRALMDTNSKKGG